MQMVLVVEKQVSYAGDGLEKWATYALKYRFCCQKQNSIREYCAHVLKFPLSFID